MSAIGISPGAIMADFRANQNMMRDLNAELASRAAAMQEARMVAAQAEAASLASQPRQSIDQPLTPPDASASSGPQGAAASAHAVPFADLLARLNPSPPASPTPATWGWAPTVSGGGGGSAAAGTAETTGAAFDAGAGLIDLLIPNPVDIVQGSKWPLDMGGHWGLPQKIGWLRAIMAPYVHIPTKRALLEEAIGLLYEHEAGAGPGKML